MDTKHKREKRSKRAQFLEILPLGRSRSVSKTRSNLDTTSPASAPGSPSLNPTILTSRRSTPNTSAQSVASSDHTLVPDPSSNSTSLPADPKAHSTDQGLGSSSQLNRLGPGPDRNLWEQAFKHLPQDGEKIFPKDIDLAGNNGCMIENVLKEARKKQQECEEKRWTFKLGGKKVMLADTAGKIIAWLDKFKTIADVAVNADPLHAGLPWAGIRILLQIAVSEQQHMSALLRGLERVLYIVDRCKIYEILYHKMIHSRDNTFCMAGKNFETAMIELYVLILGFLSNAIMLYSKHTASRTVNAVWSPNDIDEFEQKCSDLEERVEREFHNCERVYNQIHSVDFSQSEKIVKDLLGELKALTNISDSVARVDANVENMWREKNNERKAKILKWVSKIPYQDHHRTAFEGRTKGTGHWLFKHDQYQQWMLSSESMILWLHGIPGAGKTKLVAHVVDSFINRRCNEEGLAYFYFNRNEDARRSPENVLQSFVKQLSMSENRNAVHSSLIQVYENKEKAGFASNQLNSTECYGLLCDLIQAYPRTTLILDALDEAHEQHRSSLIKILDNLVKESKQLKVFISSRRDDDIKRRLEIGTNIGIEATDNTNDIGSYVLDRIKQGQTERRKPISDNLQNEIIQTLLDKSQGMFQWAALQITHILSLDRETDIRHRLGGLPKDLKHTYDEIYTEIINADGSKPEIAARAFQWVMCSKKPLPAHVLVAAVCQDPEEDDIQDIDIDIDFVLEACNNLLVLDEQLGVYRFAHLSVQEYLEEFCYSVNQANGTVAKVCLSLLNGYTDWEALDDPDFEESFGYVDNSHSLQSLINYTTSSWQIHVRDHGETNIDSRVTTLLEKFLGSPDESSLAYRNYVRYNNSHTHTLRPSNLASLPVCLFGFGNVLAEWWETGSIDPHQLNDKGETLVLLAALGNSPGVIKRLLAAGADINADIYKFGSALAAAAAVYTGYESYSAVKLLLDSGADVNAQLRYGRYGSALAAAAATTYDNNLSIIKLLLDSGADINAQLRCGEYGSALAGAAALAYNELSIIKLLLNSGADVNAQLSCGNYGSALAAATSQHYTSPLAIKLLLDSGADINAQLRCGEYGSALVAATAAAAAHYNLSIIKLLLDSGADVNAQLSCGHYGSALAAAAAYNSLSIIELLLDSGADINAQLRCGYYGSALAAAATATIAVVYNNYSAVKLLLDSGADVNAQLRCGDYGTVLEAAYARGFDDIVQLLLEYGAT